MTPGISLLDGPQNTFVYSAPEPPQLDYQDRDKTYVPRLKGTNTQPLLYEQSSLRGLALCTTRFRCKKRLCRWCSTATASEARAALRRESARYATLTTLTLSVASSPSLAEAWRALAECRQQFTRSRWLSTKSTSWFRQTEVTHTDAGWNLHDVWVIFGTPQQQSELLTAALPRWVEAASRAGHRADPAGQHASKTPHMGQAIGYAVKGLMAQHTTDTTAQGHTPGDLLALYNAGDADAAEAWAELETAFLVRGRRWVERGGELRGKK